METMREMIERVAREGLERRAIYRMAMLEQDIVVARMTLDPGLMDMVESGKVYRIEVHPNKQNTPLYISALCLGMDRIDSLLNTNYGDVSQMPMWAQEKLAKLMMIKVDPPMQPIPSVGMRIAERVFWVFED